MKEAQVQSLSRRTVRKFTAVLLCLFFLVGLPLDAHSWNLFHAASRRTTQSIALKGIRPSRFNKSARFGGKFYVSRKATTALKERGQRSALLRMKSSKYLERHTWEFRNPTARKLRPFAGRMSLRGTYKKGIIGPKLGKRIGKMSERKGMAIRYRSVKNRGTNIAIPGSMFRSHPHCLFKMRRA